MKILALEFSSELRSVAVLEETSGMVMGYASEAGGREMKALGMVQSVLAQSACDKTDIGCIAVGLGPGSYTGIRAAISLAQGWQLARGVKLLGISSAAVLAKSAQMQDVHGLLQIIIDAQRQEFYTAKYMVSADKLEELEPLKLEPASAIEALAAERAILVGPDKLQMVIKQVCPDAKALGALAIGRTDYVPGAKLEPIYLRETTFVKAPPPRIIPE